MSIEITYDIRPGSIGIVIDDYTLNPLEVGIEFFSGDGMHTFNYWGDGVISEAHMGKGVFKAHINKYLDGKSAVFIFQPRFCFFDTNIVDKIVSIWESEIGMKYDNLNILGKMIKLSHRISGKNRRICSWHTAQAYAPYYKFLDKEPQKVSPHDILRDMYYTGSKYFIGDSLHRCITYKEIAE